MCASMTADILREMVSEMSSLACNAELRSCRSCSRTVIAGEFEALAYTCK
jgi:hypothetical protein